MYCNSCGTKNPDNAKFCNSCGKQIVMEQTSDRMRVQLKCKNCNSTMSISDYNNGLVLACPYCQSKELILESEGLATERIKTDAYKEVELAKQRAEKEIAIARNEVDKARAEAERIRSQAEKIRTEAEKIKARKQREPSSPFAQSIIVTLIGFVFIALFFVGVVYLEELKKISENLSEACACLILIFLVAGLTMLYIGFRQRRKLKE